MGHVGANKRASNDTPSDTLSQRLTWTIFPDLHTLDNGQMPMGYLHTLTMVRCLGETCISWHWSGYERDREASG